MNWQWFISRTARQAGELRKHVWYILNSQRDELSPKAIAEVEAALARFDEALKTARGRTAIQAVANTLEQDAGRWLKAYPFASVRENLKEFLVSGVMILSVFSFFLQPMKIPSGSAQPTLFGNVIEDLRSSPTPLPGRGQRFLDWFRGIDYHEWVAKADGVLQVEPTATTFGFVKTLRASVGQDTYTFYWPPEQLERALGYARGQSVRKGDVVLRMKVTSGDRLFVDRLTYNFRRPERGETIVFHTVGIDAKLRVPNSGVVPNTHYIKRLIALGGEKIRIDDDRHAVVNGRRLDKNDRGFEKVYAFDGPARDSHYSGHVNNKMAAAFGRPGIAPLFPEGNSELTVRPDHYLPFGDNTMNSHDGRAWGDFPREHVVGRACFVFWPFTSRLGFVAR